MSSGAKTHIDNPHLEEGLNEKQHNGDIANGHSMEWATEIEAAEVSGPGPVPDIDVPLSPKEVEEIKAKNPNIVDWDGPDDPENPLNWPKSRKWASMSVVALMCFVSPFASTLPAPALPRIAMNFGITNSSVAALCVSIFILAYAFGPLIASPASELYGRKPVYLAFFSFFFIFNIGSALANNTTQFIVCRFFAGLGGSGPLTVGAGTAVDLFRSEQRATAMAIVSMGPLVGPIIGPVIGGFMAERLSVRWSLWLLTIISGVVLAFAFVFLRETNPDILLRNRVRKMRKETGNDQLMTVQKAARGESTAAQVFWHNMSRAVVLFFTDPSCMVIGLYMAIAYGYLYLLFVTFGYIFQENYGQSTEISGLHYIASGLGQFLGAIFSGLTMDRIYIILKKRNNGVGAPEYRVPIMMLASILMPAGLFIYGWCAEKHTHWIALDIGVFIFGFGIMISFMALNTYLLDAFRYAASAVAATAVIRSIAGALFPLFGQSMFKALGLGWGNSLLAFVALALGTTYPLFLWYHGASIRARGKTNR